MQELIQKALTKGVEMHLAGEFEFASQQYEAVLKIHPDHADANHNMGLLKLDTGNALEALPYLQTALQADTSVAEFWLSYIKALIKLSKLDEAARILDLAEESGLEGEEFLELQQLLNSPKKATEDAIKQLVESYNQGQLNAVIEKSQRILEQYPKAFIVWNILGSAAAQTGKFNKAIYAFEKAISYNSNFAEAYHNMATALNDLDRLEEATKAYERVIELQPDSATAYFNLATALQKQKQLKKSVNAFKKAIQIKSDYAEAYNNLGNSLQELGKLQEAKEAYSKAVSNKPNFVEALNNLGHVLRDLGQLEEALDAYKVAAEINPDYASARASILDLQAEICNWQELEAHKYLWKDLGIVGSSVPPFSFLSFEDNPERHRLRSENYAAEKFPQKPLAFSKEVTKRPKRLRIGYFSSDFGSHPISYLISKMLSLHDRDKFEIFAYSFGKNTEDPWRDKVIESVDVFSDVRNMNSREVALLARKHKIDIAIDLNGHTKGTRLEIFAFRAAPIQMSYLGIAMSTGAKFMDYLIADRISIKVEDEPHYSEAIMWLPDCYQVTDNSAKISKVQLNRSDAGLPENGFVFCCFNQNRKITPDVFNIWMRILHKIDGSVLWLLRSNKISEFNLRREAVKRGISEHRLVFADRLPVEEHLARHNLADLFLDTFNFNSGATGTAALWAGLPVVSKIGKSFSARVGASMLSSIGLEELIASCDDNYEGIILELATNSDRLKLVREKLFEHKRTSPLFDTERFTKNLERGYELAFRHYVDGLGPTSFYVNK